MLTGAKLVDFALWLKVINVLYVVCVFVPIMGILCVCVCVCVSCISACARAFMHVYAHTISTHY